MPEVTYISSDEPAGMRDDAILELAIQFASSGAYPAGLAKAKKRAVRKRAANLSQSHTSGIVVVVCNFL